MAIITLSDAVLASVGGLTYGQVRYDMEERSEVTGASATRLLGPPRWQFGLRSMQAMALLQAGEWEAMLLRLRGSVNHLAVHDLLRPVPIGNMRGNTRLAASRAIGDATMTIKGVRRDTQLLEAGTTLDDPIWVLTGTGGVIPDVDMRPNGVAMTADAVSDTSTSVASGIEQTITVPNDGTTYTVSIYSRRTLGALPTRSLHATLSGGTSVQGLFRWDSTTGAVLLGATTVEASGDPNWWRVSGSITNNSSGNTSLTIGFFPTRCANGSNVTDVTQTGNHTVWGIKLEAASAPSDYNVTLDIDPGDWLQVGTPGVGTSQLVKVVTYRSTTSADQLVNVQFEPPLRYAFAAEAPVTWDRPVAYCKLTNSAQTWAARANGPAIDGFALDLLEDWGA
jgi:hypothetical protein